MSIFPATSFGGTIRGSQCQESGVSYDGHLYFTLIIDFSKGVPAD